MPLQQCKLPNGKSGYKYGSKGKCYASKKDAIKQGIAIDGEDKVREELAKAGFLNDPDIRTVIGTKTNDKNGSNCYVSAVASYIEKQLAPDDDLAVAYVSAEERKKMPLSDFAWPSKRKYPISNQAHLDAAVKLLGRAPAAMQASIKARIKEIAKRKGLTLPANWDEEKSSKKK